MFNKPIYEPTECKKLEEEVEEIINIQDVKNILRKLIRIVDELPDDESLNYRDESLRDLMFSINE